MIFEHGSGSLSYYLMEFQNKMMFPSGNNIKITGSIFVTIE